MNVVWKRWHHHFFCIYRLIENQNRFIKNRNATNYSNTNNKSNDIKYNIFKLFFKKKLKCVELLASPSETFLQEWKMLLEYI